MKSDPIPKQIFDILACPICKGNLKYSSDKSKLLCPRCKKSYEIKEGIPILLP